MKPVNRPAWWQLWTVTTKLGSGSRCWIRPLQQFSAARADSSIVNSVTHAVKAVHDPAPDSAYVQK